MLTSIISLSLLMCVFFIIIFFSTFGNNALSHDPQRWAEFGDYLGGTLNTLFTLINVCVTIWLTLIINKLSSKNTEKQIEAERRIATIHLKHEALKELRAELTRCYSNWQTDIYNIKFVSKCYEPIISFSSNYSYLFDEEILDGCNALVLDVTSIGQAIQENRNDEVEKLFNGLFVKFLNFYGKVGRKVIQ